MRTSCKAHRFWQEDCYYCKRQLERANSAEAKEMAYRFELAQQEDAEQRAFDDKIHASLRRMYAAGELDFLLEPRLSHGKD